MGLCQVGRQLFWALALVVLFFPTYTQAQTHGAAITVSSATAGTTLVSSIGKAASVFVETGSTSVWVGRFPAGTTCSSAQTASVGKAMMIPADSGWLFLRSEENFAGTICGILDSAGTATVWVELW